MMGINIGDLLKGKGGGVGGGDDAGAGADDAGAEEVGKIWILYHSLTF